jgi:hypothetical protein
MIVGGPHEGRIMLRMAKYIRDLRAPESSAPVELYFREVFVFLSCPCHRHTRMHRASLLLCTVDKRALRHRISADRISILPDCASMEKMRLPSYAFCNR